LPPGVGDPPCIEVQAIDVIGERNALRRFRARFIGELRRVNEQLRFRACGVVRLDQRIEDASELIGIRFALHRVGLVADRCRSNAVGGLLGNRDKRHRRSAFDRQGRELVCFRQLGRFGKQGLKRVEIHDRRPFRRVEFSLGNRCKNVARERGNSGTRRCPLARIDRVENPAPVFWHHDRPRRRSDLSDDDRLLRLRCDECGFVTGRWGGRRSRHPRCRGGIWQGREGVGRDLRKYRSGPDQGSEREQSGLQDSSSISSNKSFHASDLFEG
jgi:hypothetical protein